MSHAIGTSFVHLVHLEHDNATNNCSHSHNPGRLSITHPGSSGVNSDFFVIVPLKQVKIYKRENPLNERHFSDYLSGFQHTFYKILGLFENIY